MRNKNTKKGFTLVELLVVIAILGIMSTMVFDFLRRSSDNEAFDSLKTVITGGLESITQNAKNGVTDPDLWKFKESSNDLFRQIYAQAMSNPQKENPAHSQFSPINQTSFYYGLYFNVWKTFIKEVQYEQEGCKEKRDALTQKWQNGTNFADINFTDKELNLDISALMSWEANTLSRFSDQNQKLKETELLDSGHCYISSKNLPIGTSRPIYLMGIDFRDGRWMQRDENTAVVLLADANDPFKVRIFNKETKVNAIRNQFDYDIDGLNENQKKFLLKNHWVDQIQKAWDLEEVHLEFAMSKSNPFKCQDWDFVDFSTRANAWAKYEDNFKRNLICLKINKESIQEIMRSR